MKKIFTLIAVAALALGVNAQTINLAGLAPTDFTYDDTEFAASSGEDSDGTPYQSLSYTKKDKTNYSYIQLTGQPVKFGYKNSGAKNDFFRGYADFFYANGKGSRIVVTGLAAGQVVTLKASGKNADGAIFAAVTNCTADEGNPTDPIGKVALEDFVDVKFAATAAGDVEIEENCAGYRIISITIGEGGGVTPPDDPKPSDANALVDFPAQKGVGYEVEGSTEVTTVKIHENKDAVDCIKFANSYKSNDELSGNDLKLSVDGGFKAGDVITLAGAINSGAEDKRATVVLFSVADGKANVINKFEDFIDGKVSAEDPAEQTFTLTEDAETLYLGRDGNTGANVTLLKVARANGGEVDFINSIKAAELDANAPMFNLAGQRVGKNYKGVVLQNGKKFVNK